MNKGFAFAVVGLLLTVLACTSFYCFSKYRVADSMLVSIEEISSADYPEDPSNRSVFYDTYNNRTLKLKKKDANHFDFIFESKDPSVATVAFKDIDLRLFIPVQPVWTRADKNLEIIALTDREWNRQQVSFDRNSSHLEITGGDGTELMNLYSADLARNCLNAGLWEVLFFTQENGEKSLYYQGWFNFPLGHYKDIFENENNISYWKHWHRLEHWFNPQGTPVDLKKLRQVQTENEVEITYDLDEKLIVAGEQLRKARTFSGKGVRCWKDFCRTDRKVQFATFIAPGRYSVAKPWGNEFDRIEKLEKLIARKVKTPASENLLDEIELIFRSQSSGEQTRFIVSGLDFKNLPVLSSSQYNKGLYMPMGIGVPPFYQSYSDLEKMPPSHTSYFSVMLDGKGSWLNHHDIAIDGPVMHLDAKDPRVIHLYLLSYERHSLVGHYEFPIQ